MANGSTRWPEDEEGKRVLVVTRGHPFLRDPFFELFGRVRDIEWAHVEHPAAETFFDPERAKDYDCYVLYDMPGIEFVPGNCLLYTSPSPRDKRQSRMPSSA